MRRRHTPSKTIIIVLHPTLLHFLWLLMEMRRTPVKYDLCEDLLELRTCLCRPADQSEEPLTVNMNAQPSTDKRHVWNERVCKRSEEFITAATMAGITCWIMNAWTWSFCIHVWASWCQSPCCHSWYNDAHFPHMEIVCVCGGGRTFKDMIETQVQLTGDKSHVLHWEAAGFGVSG